MSTLSTYLSRCYAIRGGKIDPWGTIRLLNKTVEEPSEDDERYTAFKNCIELQPGLKVWSKKLVPYGKMGGYRAVIANEVVEVVAEDGVVVEEIPHSDFIVVEVRESLVHNNGYLECTLGRGTELHDGTWAQIIPALEQAAKGEKPEFCDNSPFVKVDPKLAGQEVIQLRHGTYDGEDAMVYSRDGEHIHSTFHFPLSYAKWDPTNYFAQFSRPDRVLS